MHLAHFQTSFKTPAISAEDRTAGIIRGVRVMEPGKMASFSATKADGTKVHKEVKLADVHASALMTHAGNRGIPVHLTHEWSATKGKPNAATAELSARIGAVKSLRKDDGGILIGDLYLKSGPSREDVLFGAEHTPENMMLSAVFSFLPEDENCIPQDFQFADIVPQGAGVTAMLADDATATDGPAPMDIHAFIAALQNPEVLAALKAVIKSVESGAKDKADASETNDTANDDAGQTAAMALEADVTDADKKPEDAKFRPLVACFMQCERARVRKSTAAIALFEKAKADILIAAEAKHVAMMGSTKVPAKVDTQKSDTALFGIDKVKSVIRAQLSKQSN